MKSIKSFNGKDNQNNFLDVIHRNQREDKERADNYESRGVYQRHNQQNINYKMMANFERLTQDIKSFVELNAIKNKENQSSAETMNAKILCELAAIKTQNMELLADNKELKLSMEEMKEEMKQLKEINQAARVHENNEADKDIVMSCQYENMSNDNDNNGLICNVTNLTVHDAKLNVKMLTEGEMKESDNVEKFRLRNQTVLYMPINLGTIFKNLMSLRVSECPLVSIQRENFANMQQLVYLCLSHNNLHSIPAEVFDDLINLKTLLLSNNQLESLPSGIFDKLVHLKAINLFNNQIQILPDHLFIKNFNLEVMDVTCNPITTIPPKLLLPLVKLKQCLLSSSLKANTPSQMRKLKSIVYSQLGNQSTADDPHISM